MKVAIYIRVSTEEQAREGYSLAAQERSLREKCSREGWEVYDVYADRGISGKDITHRPAMTTMLDDASRHEFDRCAGAVGKRTCICARNSRIGATR